MLGRLWQSLRAYCQEPLSVTLAREQEELCEEIAFHVDRRIEDAAAEGMDPQQSRSAALQRFGDVPSVLAECSHANRRRQWIVHRLHQAITLLLVVATLILWSERSTRPPAMTPAGDIVGAVLAENGDVVDSAFVLAVVKTWPDGHYRQDSYVGITGPDGKFQIADVYPIDQEYEVQLAVVADGRRLESKYIDQASGSLPPQQFRLKNSETLALRFESDSGLPVAGVRVFPFERLDQDGQRHCVYFSSAEPIVRTSSESGDVPLPHFAPGDRATVYVCFPDGDWQTRELTVPKVDQVVVLRPRA